jgi:hypothetical protein
VSALQHAHTPSSSSHLRRLWSPGSHHFFPPLTKRESSASSSHPASGYTRILHPSLSKATVPSIFPTLFLQSFGRYTGYHVSSLFPLPFFCHDVFEFLRQNDPLTTLRRDEYEMFCTSFFFFYGAYKCVARVYIVFFVLKKSGA